MSPVSVRQKGTAVESPKTIGVPCGKCHECRAARSASWAFRLFQEDRNHPVSHFVTLTYSDDNLTWTDNGPTLVKSDLQKFFKRLRKNSKRYVKYYACGEYGGDTRRPHYHAIIFGARDVDIDAAWGLGNTFYGDVGLASIRYVTNYLCKSVGYNVDGLVPEFALMSKGLGASYMTPQMIAWHHAHLANYVVNPGGQRQLIPRYYKQKIFDEYQRAAIARDHAEKYEVREKAAEAKQGAYTLESRRLESVRAAIRAANYKTKKRNVL